MAIITLEINDELADRLRSEANGKHISKETRMPSDLNDLVANEATIARIWDTPEEDAAWEDL